MYNKEEFIKNLKNLPSFEDMRKINLAFRLFRDGDKIEAKNILSRFEMKENKDKEDLN